MTKLIFTALLLPISYILPAAAANWVIVSSTDWPPKPDSSLTLEIDTDSIRVREGYRQAWVSYTNNPPKSTIYGKSAATTVTLDIFDCRNDESSTISSVSYTGPFRAGDTFDMQQRTRAQAVASMQAVLPGSFGETTLRFVCARLLK